MSPDPYFHFISGLYLGNHIKYFNDTLENYTTGQCKVSHARMKTQLFFLIFSNYLPRSIFLIAAAVGKPGFRGISTFLSFFFFFYLFNFQS